MTTPSDFARIGTANPNSRMLARIRSTALSFLRGLRSYGFSLSIGQYSTRSLCISGARFIVILRPLIAVRDFSRQQSIDISSADSAPRSSEGCENDPQDWHSRSLKLPECRVV